MSVPLDNKVIKDLTKALKRQNNFYRPHQVVLRGFINGIFTALGATIGFALFIVIAGWFIGVTGDIPIVSYILEETKLDILIENQLNQIEQGNIENNHTPKPTNTTPTPTSDSVLPTGETGTGSNTVN